MHQKGEKKNANEMKIPHKPLSISICFFFSFAWIECWMNWDEKQDGYHMNGFTWFNPLMINTNEWNEVCISKFDDLTINIFKFFFSQLVILIFSLEFDLFYGCSVMCHKERISQHVKERKKQTFRQSIHNWIKKIKINYQFALWEWN